MRKESLKSGSGGGRKSAPRKRQAKAKTTENGAAQDPKMNPSEEPLLEHAGRDTLLSVLPFLEERVAFKLPSDLKYLDGVLDYINERMIRLGIINAGDSEVLIALDEAIVNAIKHGNKCDPQKTVEVVAHFNSCGVQFVVTDCGAGFSRDSVPDPTDPSRLLEPSGRGLLLINHIMDEVCYNGCGNEIRMLKRSPKRIEAERA